MGLENFFVVCENSFANDREDYQRGIINDEVFGGTLGAFNVISKTLK